MSFCDRKIRLNSNIESRTFAGVTVPAGSYRDATFTFNKPFSGTPTVITNIIGTADNVYRGNVTISVTNRTATGFMARVYNASSAELSIAFCWAAIGL